MINAGVSNLLTSSVSASFVDWKVRCPYYPLRLTTLTTSSITQGLCSICRNLAYFGPILLEFETPTWKPSSQLTASVKFVAFSNLVFHVPLLLWRYPQTFF